ncbi:hypothetical protein ACQCVK_16825 [Rossellomorea vietnamensis]|uniref:Uncharacterized protein n=1 Tax=Rossellomorea aquimaris TaxID=189382 RepID=A0A5D4UA24_9BACI|nr:hypothetical protein [Rossellomorea aquimaris]TYS84276.1 hypothetical protein FZC80_01990 [Rossellomorea aquimaris]
MERKLKQLDKDSYLNEMKLNPSKKQEMLRNIKKTKQGSLSIYTKWGHHVIGVTACFILMFFSIGLLKDTPLISSSEEHEEIQKTSGVTTEQLYLKANIIGLPNQAVIRGQSNFPGGTKLNIKVYPSEKLDSILEEQELVTKKDGSFSLLITRKAREEDYFLTLELYPYEQNEKVRKVIGPNGNKLQYEKKISGQVRYSYKENIYTGIRLYGKIFALDEFTTGQKTMMLEDIENVKE